MANVGGYNEHHPDKPLDLTPKSRLVVEFAEEKTEKELFFVEADAVFAMLYEYHNNSVGLTLTFDCNGEKYTDISDLTLFIEKSCDIDWPDELGDVFYGCSFYAKKGDNAKTGYALFNRIPLFDGPVDYEWKYGITPISSHGIYETGSLLQLRSVHYLSDTYTYTDEYMEPTYYVADGELGETLSHKIEMVDVLIFFVDSYHFFEKNGSDFRFIEMKDGKITHKQITKTGDAVTFYRPDAENTGDEIEIEFKKANGKYIVDKEYEFGDGFKGENFCFTLPELAGKDYSYFDDSSRSQVFTYDQLNNFYKALSTAKLDAFKNAEKYFITAKQLLDDNANSSETVVLERIGDEKGKYAFSHDGVKVAALLSGDVKASDDLKDISFDFAVNVDSLTFENGSGKVTELLFLNNKLNVRISESGKTLFDKPFDVLRIDPDFAAKSRELKIPSNLYFETEFKKFVSDEETGFELCRKINDVISKMDPNQFKKYVEERIEREVREILSEDGKTPLGSVIKTAIALAKEYEETHEIPNIVILGQAGTGKTTLAAKLARVFGREINLQGPSSLKGAYEGQTMGRVAQQLINTATKEQVMFIDEAYELMKDDYGREALAMLLPIMSGDKDFVETNGSLQETPVRVYFGDPNDPKNKPRKETLNKAGEITSMAEMSFKPGVVPIWFAGYEDEVRKMISENQGLYRRLKKVAIPTPLTSQLVEEFKDLLKNSRMAHADELRTYFEENGYDSVEKFFVWGALVQNSKFFGSHGGVINFFNECNYSLDFKEGLEPQIKKS